MKAINWIFILLGISGLIGVRILESQLFYDPFLEYFKHSGNGKIFPEVNWWPMTAGYLFRFLLNFIFSLVIVQFLFQKKAWTLQAAVLILLVFLIVFPIYLICIHNHFEIGEMFVFYIRRFVIQPLTLLLIVPLFYYRKHLENN